jgi:hypothetical protein
VKAARVQGVVDVETGRRMTTKVVTGKLYFLAKLKRPRYFLQEI